MEYEEDDEVLEDEEVQVGYPDSMRKAGTGVLDSRRLIERRLELKQLREQLEDPGFFYDFD